MHRVTTDPCEDPSIIVSYGLDGHEGKTTLANCLTLWLAGAVMWSSEDLIGYKSKWPKVDDVMRVCEKRILIYHEYKIKDVFSNQHIKRWTSNAPLSSSGTTGLLSQALIVIPNKIPSHKRAAVNNSIVGRFVIYDKRKKLGKEKPLLHGAIDD